MSVKITFIGTGDATNSGGRAQQSILLSTDNFKLLVDCGANTLMRFQQMQLNPNDVDAILFTHFHADHFMGTAHFDLSLLFDFPRKRDMLYIGPVGLNDRCEKLFQLSYPNLYSKKEYNHFARKITEYEPNQKYVIDNNKVIVETFPMEHAPESLGYRIFMGGKYVAITGDTQWHEGIIDLAKGSDCLICESFHYNKPEPRIGHCSYQEIKENRDRIDSNKIILVHGHKEVIANAENLDIALANDGDIVELE
ncbi:MBL fold metallo-hydrolase [Candidatus Uabimicrobium sp. HlEnr_7]|uniref:MBL fold metallo-hydrolase n=1 Tax=Candidatus Uabimicrobium helgolandensis TaxID=3095367 RepID=UPI0035582F9B